jgi:hypothetical protein
VTPPRLLTFDLFGTVVDWRAGLVHALGFPLDEAAFERVIDFQAADEQAAFRPYAEIVARSLTSVLGVAPRRPARSARGRGSGRLRRRARGVCPPARARALRRDDQQRPRAPPAIERQLGCALEPWICAGEVGAYKPDCRIWERGTRATGTAVRAAQWWHVSAYADYDLATARSLGLTTILVRRPTTVPGTTELVDRAFRRSRATGFRHRARILIWCGPPNRISTMGHPRFTAIGQTEVSCTSSRSRLSSSH